MFRLLLFAIVVHQSCAGESAWEPLFLRARGLQSTGAHADAIRTYMAAAFEAERAQDRSGAVKVYNDLACLYQDLGKFAEAEDLLRKTLPVLESLTPRPELDIATVNYNLAVGFRLQKRFEEAERLHQIALRTRERLLGEQQGETAASLYALGMVYLDNGQIQAAEKIVERAAKVLEKLYGPEDPNLAAPLQVLADVHAQLRKTRIARRESKRALLILEKAMGPEHPHVGMALENLGRVESAAGRYRDAANATHRAIRILERWWGSDHRLTIGAKIQLAEIKRMENLYVEAERILIDAGQALDKLGDPAADANLLYYLGRVYADQNKHLQAEAAFRKSRTRADASLGADSPISALSSIQLARTLLAVGKIEEAEKLYRTGLAIAEQVFGQSHPEMPAYLEFHASMLRKLHRKPEAKELEKRARLLRDRSGDSDWSRLTVDASELERPGSR